MDSMDFDTHGILQNMTALPIEIMNKIFLYMSSPTSNIIRNSKIFSKPFPLMSLRRVDEPDPFPFPTKIEMDYRRIYYKICKNRLSYDNNEPSGYHYRRFHEFSNQMEHVEDVDHDDEMNEETDSEIIEDHMLYFIFHNRYWYNRYRDVINGVYDHYLNHPRMYEQHPWYFRKHFDEYLTIHARTHATTSKDDKKDDVRDDFVDRVENVVMSTRL